MMRLAGLVLVAAACGCWKSPPSTPTPPPPAHDDAAPSPPADATARARQIVEAQLAAASSDDPTTTPDQRDAALRATFAPGAQIVLPIEVRPATKLGAVQFDRISIATLEAGGTADVVWFVATFHDDATENFRNPSDPTAWFPARYVGVAARSAGWKVVAASLQESLSGRVQGTGAVGAEPIANGAKGGALTALVLDGPALAKALPPTGAVLALGGALARGPVELGPWGTRTLVPDPDVHEVVTPTWGLVQARVGFSTGQDHGTLALLAVATRRANGAWIPIFVQYLAY